MPKSKHTRNGRPRKKFRGSTAHKIRCKFCRRVKGKGHPTGCPGQIADRVAGATTFQYR